MKYTVKINLIVTTDLTVEDVQAIVNYNLKTLNRHPDIDVDPVSVKIEEKKILDYYEEIDRADYGETLE